LTEPELDHVVDTSATRLAASFLVVLREVLRSREITNRIVRVGERPFGQGPRTQLGLRDARRGALEIEETAIVRKGIGQPKDPVTDAVKDHLPEVMTVEGEQVFEVTVGSAGGNREQRIEGQEITKGVAQNEIGLAEAVDEPEIRERLRGKWLLDASEDHNEIAVAAEDVDVGQ